MSFSVKVKFPLFCCNQVVCCTRSATLRRDSPDQPIFALGIEPVINIFPALADPSLLLLIYLSVRETLSWKLAGDVLLANLR